MGKGCRGIGEGERKRRMAQINMYTYLNQITWMIIIYSVYYIIMKVRIIPRINYKMKIRNKIFKRIRLISKPSAHYLYPL